MQFGPGVELNDALDVAENTVVDYREIIKHLFFNRRFIFQLLDIICTATINLAHCENPSVRAAIHSYLVSINQHQIRLYMTITVI